MQKPQDLHQSGVFADISAPPDELCPIAPHAIRSGAPLTRCHGHSSTTDGYAWTVVWDCTRSTFDWYYDVDEVVVILEGSVRVTDCHGTTHTLNVGDAGYFPCGTTWFWEVDDYVRKVAFCHKPVPRGMHLPVRIAHRLVREVRRCAGLVVRLRNRLSARAGRAAGLGRTTAIMMLLGIPL